MFYIRPKHEHLVNAMVLLSHYHVAAESYIDNDDTLYLAIIPDHFEAEDDDVGLAEAAFMMNWHQGGKCPECQDTCGHMAFTKPITPTF